MPMPAIAFEALDKWFVPGDPGDAGELCTIKYGIEGLPERADKVSLDVYGSHYSKASVAGDGTVSWTEVDVPVYSQQQPQERCSATTNTPHAVPDWSGASSATDGILKPGSGKKRYINVAFSPYTVHLRHYKHSGDAKARLALEAFWPRWDKNTPPQVEPDSLKIKWKVSDCANLAHGQLLIVDRGDKPVFRRALKKEELKQGAHEFVWDGKLDDGTSLEQARMPYRVQLQARTAPTTVRAVALAAMHTEVRLFVHPDTGKHEEHELHLDPSSLELAFAPFAPVAPTKNADEARWLQYELAQAGFHPGPVDGNLTRDETKRALREFQRSVPKGTAAPFGRLTVTGAKDGDTVTELERLPAIHRRALLGDPASQANLALDDTTARLLRDPTQELIVWVDDRHVYTDPSGTALPNAKMGLGNYRGGMAVGDGRVGNDADEIARSWIPLEVRLPLLNKARGLDDTRGVESEATRGLIGPLRIDWSFDEPPEDMAIIDPAAYDKTCTRTQASVKHYKQDKEQSLPDGRKRQNALDTLGGIRPNNGANYHKAPFGFDSSSLAPWPAFTDDTRKVVCSSVHDDLGQAADKLFLTHVGKAGMFFTASAVAGDGYRVRARLGLEKSTAESNPFPNREVLEKRYPLVPHAHSAGLRVWRRTSYRGYLRWAPATQDKWAANKDPAARLYRGARLHFVDEPTLTGTGLHHDDVTTFMNQARFKTLVQTYVTSPPWNGHSASITLEREHVWPYATVLGFGISHFDTTYNATVGKVLREFFNTRIEALLNATWRRYRYALLYEVVDGIESAEGRLRGHFMVEFATPEMELIEYHCDGCDFARMDVDNNRVPLLRFNNANCPTGCGGMLQHARTWHRKLNFPAVGGALGAAFLFDSGPEVWAHEMGHHRHLQHAQAWPGNANIAPGAQNTQHDSEPNPNPAILGEPAKDRAWDRQCIMSYNHTAPLAFCGKCVLKMRGWKVEGLTNPGGATHDP